MRLLLTKHHWLGAHNAQVRSPHRRHCRAAWAPRAALTTKTAPAVPNETTTERIFREMDERGASTKQAGGAGGSTTLEALKRADAAWLDLRTRKVYGPRPEFVRLTNDPLPSAFEYDVAVCGGTLGIFLGCALQVAGLRVAVVERGPVQGREQEWNISRGELAELVALGVMSQQEVEECISSEFNPMRAAFYGTPDVWTSDVLNLGVRPDRLVERVRRRFEGAGGRILEHTGLEGIWVHPNGASLTLGGSSSGSASAGGQGALAARLVLDCMGHASPVVRQIRHGQKPDGVCLVVGTCARGFPAESNTTGDIILTNSPSTGPASSSSGASGSSGGEDAPGNLQYFWEAFPAGSGPADRTIYMFTYLDSSPERPTLAALLEDYWHLMPQYQGVELEQLEVRRVLFGCFPTYKDSPLPPSFDRVLQVGDASGIQSPLSFGGFGALSRHLRRLTTAVKEAVEADALDRSSLALINAYNPGLSGAWMLQRAMSVPAGKERYNRDFINTLLGANFQAMAKKGDPVLKPFLQDVIQFGPLGQTLAQQILDKPLFVPQILAWVGPGAIASWTLHFAALGIYTALGSAAARWGWAEKAEQLPPRQRFLAKRALDNWRYGAGLDYHG